MPLNNRESRPRASKGIGAGSKTTESYVGAIGAPLCVAGDSAGRLDDERRLRPREGPRRPGCFALECVVLVFKG